MAPYGGNPVLGSAVQWDRGLARCVNPGLETMVSETDVPEMILE
jgi:hypothetical protein